MGDVRAAAGRDRRLRPGRLAMVFTDIQASTRLFHHLGDEYISLLQDHNRILREAFAAHEGVEVGTQGDSLFVVFDAMSDAVAAANDGQQALAAHRWPRGVELLVRMGVHFGNAEVSDDDLVGLDVHRAARISSAAHGGQVIVSDDARAALCEELGGDVSLRDLGSHGLKDLPGEEHLYQLLIPGLPSDFPPPRTEEAAPAASAAALEHVRRRHRRRVALLLGVLSVSVMLGVAGLLTGGNDAPPSVPGAGELLVLDPRSGDVRRTVALGATPQIVAAGAGSVWVLDADEQTLVQVDPDSGSAATFATGATPTDVAAGGAGVWVGEGERAADVQAAGPLPVAVARLDPQARTVRARVTLPRRGGLASRTGTDHIAVDNDAVWAVSASGTVVRIDPVTDAVVATVRGLRAQAVASGEGGVWLLGLNGELARVDRARNQIDLRTEIETSAPGSLAVGAGSAWVSAPADGAIWRVDPAAPSKPRLIDVGVGVTDIASGAGGIWAVNPLRGEIVRVDPRTNQPRRISAPGGLPRGIAISQDAVFVAVSRETTELPAAVTGDASGLSRNVCGPIFAGVKQPDRIIVADLPLQGGLRLSAQQVYQSIAFVLRRRGFRAGKLDIGLQACDHSIARTGVFDEAKCAANARAYGANRRVIGVIGPINTPCALASLGETNRAGLPVISPTASFPGLTRALPEAPKGEFEQLYPTGRRHFVRVFPPDDRQAAALALLAQRLGARRVAVVHDGDPMYGVMLAQLFTRRARELGLDATRPRSWGNEPRDRRRAAAAAARDRPDAVMLSGILDSGGAAVLAALRPRVGEDVALLVPDGFTPTPFLVEQAGADAARGTYLSVNGLIPEALPAAGRRFVRAFGTTLPGAEIEPSAVYAAAATEVMLDAIAVSGGHRDRVRRALFRRRFDTVLGATSFDARGDPRAPAVSILRIKPGSDTRAFEHTTFEQVVAGTL